MKFINHIYFLFNLLFLTIPNHIFIKLNYYFINFIKFIINNHYFN